MRSVAYTLQYKLSKEDQEALERSNNEKELEYARYLRDQLELDA